MGLFWGCRFPEETSTQASLAYLTRHLAMHSQGYTVQSIREPAESNQEKNETAFSKI